MQTKQVSICKRNGRNENYDDDDDGFPYVVKLVVSHDVNICLRFNDFRSFHSKNTNT